MELKREISNEICRRKGNQTRFVLDHKWLLRGVKWIWEEIQEEEDKIKYRHAIIAKTKSGMCKDRVSESWKGIRGIWNLRSNPSEPWDKIWMRKWRSFTNDLHLQWSSLYIVMDCQEFMVAHWGRQEEELACFWNLENGVFYYESHAKCQFLYDYFDCGNSYR